MQWTTHGNRPSTSGRSHCRSSPNRQRRLCERSQPTMEQVQAAPGTAAQFCCVCDWLCSYVLCYDDIVSSVTYMSLPILFLVCMALVPRLRGPDLLMHAMTRLCVCVCVPIIPAPLASGSKDGRRWSGQQQEMLLPLVFLIRANPAGSCLYGKVRSDGFLCVFVCYCQHVWYGLVRREERRSPIMTRWQVSSLDLSVIVSPNRP
jgi:hypothetical protein